MKFLPGEVKTAHAMYVGVDGKPAEVQGDVKWTVDPAGAVEFVPGADRLAIGVVMGAPVALFTLTATADADLRDGADFVRDLAIKNDPADPFEISAPEATGGAVTVS